MQSHLIDQITDLFEAYLDWEHDLFDRKIDDFAYWHYIRFSFFLEVCNDRGWMTRTALREQLSLREKTRIVLELLSNATRYKISRDVQTTDLLVVNTCNRSAATVGDAYVHPWLNHLPYSYTIWEAPRLWRHHRHDGTQDLFYLDALLLKTQIYRHSLLPRHARIRREVEYLIDFARDHLQVRISRSTLYRQISYVLALYRSCYTGLEQQLRRKSPKVVFLLNHYDPVKMLIIEIARKLGIYTVELQHGTIGRYHISYNFGHRKKLAALPDEIFMFGQYWCDTTRVSQNGVLLTATGLPYFEDKVRSVRQVESEVGKTTILFISQDTIGVELAELAIVLADKLDLSVYQIWFKMHPREYGTWQRRYPAGLQSGGIKVLTDADLYSALYESAIHVGVYSTTIIESLAFGKKLILYESYGIHFFTQLIETGRALLVRNAEELFDAIISNRPESVQQHDISYYWQPASKDNIVARTKQIMARHD